MYDTNILGGVMLCMLESLSSHKTIIKAVLFIDNYRAPIKYLHYNWAIKDYLLAKNTATTADFLAFLGSPAPSKLPTLIPAAVPMPNGIYGG